MSKSVFLSFAIMLFPFLCNAQENNIVNQELSDSPNQEQQISSSVVSNDFRNNDLEDLLANATVETIETLKNEGFDFNSKDNAGNPPLYYLLARNQDLEVAKKAIEYGADVNTPARNGMLPLNIATSKANELQLQIMMMETMGLDTNNPEVQEELKKKLFHEMTRAIEMAKLLIENGANVNLTSTLGTPLMNAVTNIWNLDIVKIIIDAGADLDIKDNNGKTALFYAQASGNSEVVKLLIEHGANTEIKDVSGKVYTDMEMVNVDPAI